MHQKFVAGTLPPDLRRNTAYKGQTPMFGDDKSYFIREAVSSEDDAFTPTLETEKKKGESGLWDRISPVFNVRNSFTQSIASGAIELSNDNADREIRKQSSEKSMDPKSDA